MHLDILTLTVKRLHSKDYLVLVHKCVTITRILPLQPLRKCRRQRTAPCYSLWLILFSATQRLLKPIPPGKGLLLEAVNELLAERSYDRCSEKIFPYVFSCIKELLSFLVNLFFAGSLFDIFVLFLISRISAQISVVVVSWREKKKTFELSICWHHQLGNKCHTIISLMSLEMNMENWKMLFCMKRDSEKLEMTGHRPHLKRYMFFNSLHCPDSVFRYKEPTGYSYSCPWMWYSARSK